MRDRDASALLARLRRLPVRRDAMPPPKYKVCRTCGNRNHPESRQCPWCGARLRGRLDWFSILALWFIASVVAVLIACAVQSRSLKPSRLHLPGREAPAP